MCVSLPSVYTMGFIVFLTLLAICTSITAYQPVNSYGAPAFGYEHELQELPESYTSQPVDHYQAHADFHKHFYAFEAPQDSSEEALGLERKIAALSPKNLQVVFVKAPENKALEGALHAYAKLSGQDKTAIYVLNKQTDADSLASKLSALRAQHKHKPEVHFVKYRTDEEAAHAQQHIQALYGGPVQQQPQAQAPPLPAPLPSPGYLPPYSPNYYGGASDIDLPPVPLPQQELEPSSYEVEARGAKSKRVDFRINERQHEQSSRMVFPKDNGQLEATYSTKYLTPARPGVNYLPPPLGNAYLPPPINRKRRSHL